VVTLWISGRGLESLASPPADLLISVGRITGLVAADLLLVQVVLMARVPWIERSYGQDELARRYPRAHVVRDVLFTVDDRVVTSAGIASGVDLALHLVNLRHGPAAAARVARSMVVYGRRNGDAQQISAMLGHRAHLNDTVHRVQDLIDARFDRRIGLAELAGAARVSERTLTRLFAHATGSTPLRYQHMLRVERAEDLIAQGSTVEAAARTVGFEDARMLRRLRAR